MAPGNIEIQDNSDETTHAELRKSPCLVVLRMLLIFLWGGSLHQLPRFNPIFFARIRMLTGASVGPVSAGGNGRARRVSSGTAGSTAGSTLLLTEYLAFVLDHRRHEDVRLAADAFGTWNPLHFQQHQFTCASS